MRIDAIIAAVILLSACQTVRENGSSVKESVSIGVFGYPFPEPCPEGSSQLLYQLAKPVKITRADVTLKGNIEWFEQQSDYDDTGYRFDLCLNDANDDITLMRMIQRQPAPSAFNSYYNEYRLTNPIPDSAWKDAIVNGGSTELKAIFVSEADPKSSVILQGWKSSLGEIFMTVSQFDGSTNDVMTVTNPLVKYGAFVEGSPWDNKYKNHDRLIKAGKIEIELRYDLLSGQNGYKQYKVHSIHIKDATQGTAHVFEATVSEPDLDTNLKIEFTHHSLQDEFILTFPHATYRIGRGLKVEYKPVSGLAPLSFDLGCGQVAECGSNL